MSNRLRSGWGRWFWLSWLWLALAQGAVAGGGAELPAEVAKALRAAQVPLEAVGVWVQEVDASAPGLALNVDKAFNPASVMKLVTTSAGLEVLGPAYVWQTQALTAGRLENGVLEGDLYLRGGGDPRLTLDALYGWMREWRARGLREIRGDIVVDRTLFEIGEVDPGRFDGQPLRAYNVIPDALLLNYQTIMLLFVPGSDGRVAVSADPAAPEVEVVSRLRLTEGGCANWRAGLSYALSNEGGRRVLTFSGSYPASCGERIWTLAPLQHQEYANALLTGLWRDVGGTLAGRVRDGAVPQGAKLLSVHQSPPLADQVRDINKWSNNVMARQLFLTLGAEQAGEMSGVTEADGDAVVRGWMQGLGIDVSGLVLENGSGLSRRERITPAALGQLLLTMWRSPTMPEFIASMPVYGVDGTLRKRAKGRDVAGRAHLKGGTLSDVRAIAGYVLDANGRRQVLVWLVNHPNAAATQAAQDALVQWVHDR